jgi:predicted DNA-binding transcriptional regulator YafY
VVRPLGAFFWGRSWTLAAWCELRQDFRNFRLDRIARADLLADTFADEPGRTLGDLLARYGPDAVKLLAG